VRDEVVFHHETTAEFVEGVFSPVGFLLLHTSDLGTGFAIAVRAAAM
jgi:hypothetical protein